MKTDLPKVLHRVGSESMLGRVVRNLREAGVADIIAVVGYKAEIVESLFKDAIRFVIQPELLGSGDALAHAVDYMAEGEGTVLVTCGDTPLIESATYKRLVQAHRKKKSSCTLLTSEVEDPTSYGRIIRGRRGEIAKIVEEKDSSGEEKKVAEINVGTYCFRKTDLKRHIRDIELNEKKKEFYLTDIVDILTRGRKKVLSAPCDPEEALGVNSRKDLAEVNKIINDRTIDKLMKSGVTIIDPATTYVDGSAVIGRDTVIYPCTVIESDVKVAAGCRIGPFARLRPGTRLAGGAEIGNFVELCRAEIGEGAKVKHHTYLGDAKVGRNANIGAGTITANYDGKNKNRTEIGEGAFVGVGAVLIAPVKVGKNAVVGAGSVVTKKKNVPAGKTVAGVPARMLSSKKK